MSIASFVLLYSVSNHPTTRRHIQEALLRSGGDVGITAAVVHDTGTGAASVTSSSLGALGAAASGAAKVVTGLRSDLGASEATDGTLLGSPADKATAGRPCMRHWRSPSVAGHGSHQSFCGLILQITTLTSLA